jgi:4,5-dihydroxyphthalate decarboxylase
VPADLDGPLAPEDPTNRFAIDRYLVDGRIDALLSAYNPSGLHAGSPTVRRLIPDFQAVERDYYMQTGIFPIMHVVTVQRSLVEKQPWLPASLTQAFTRAKQEAYHRLRNPRALPLAFSQSAWSEQDRLMGPDPWQFSCNRARRTTPGCFC